MEIYNWNVSPNREWFVRLVDDGTDITVELYLSAADAAAQTNRQAAGTSSRYGEELPVTLVNEEDASEPVAVYQPDYDWHVKVSGQAGDAAVTYRVKEFVELGEISHSIYRSESLIASRAQSEIDAHTHVKINHSASLSIHGPSSEIGDIVQITSSSRAISAKGQASRLSITGHTSNDGTTSLTDSIDVEVFENMQR